MNRKANKHYFKCINFYYQHGNASQFLESFILTLSGDVVIWPMVALKKRKEKSGRKEYESHFTFLRLVKNPKQMW